MASRESCFPRAGALLGSRRSRFYTTASGFNSRHERKRRPKSGIPEEIFELAKRLKEDGALTVALLQGSSIEEAMYLR